MPTPLNRTRFKDQAQARTLRMAAPDPNRSFYVEGYAANYEEYLLYDDGEYGRVFERFEPGCFDGCDMSDVILQYDHAGRVYARTTNNTLTVEPNEHGLFITADLSKTAGAQELYADIDAGLITKMSWRFRVGDYHVDKKQGSKDVTIVHTKIPKIYDVSAVSIPANDGTEINARSWADGVIGELARREAQDDEKRRKIKLLSTI